MRTKQLLAKIKRKVSLNKKRKSANKIAKEEVCSITTVVIHEDLSLNTYKIRVQTLTANQIQRRESYAHWIKNEKWFDQDGQYNRQNDCVYAESREAENKDFGIRPVHKFPFKVMAWVGTIFKELQVLLICPKKLHLMRLFTSKMH